VSIFFRQPITMNKLMPGWYSEVSDFWPGQAQSLEVEEVFFDGRSDFQDLKVFKTKAWGMAFTLDGAIQVCDKDEFSYHENMAHIALFCHPNPKHVLIIGGGDGGVLREVLRHASVEKCTICDVDKLVPEIARKYFPKVSCDLDDPRAEVVIGDGFAFLADKHDCYDAIIVDSSDPEGPASTLFGKEFFDRCKNALRHNGNLVTQAECMWIHLDLIAKMKTFIESIGWASVEYANISMPSYPSGCIGFFVCSKRGSCKEPLRPVPEAMLPALQYYDDVMHRAAFMLPRFVRNRLKL